ncbi:MAG: hypothetical protein R3195_03585 [Gemmatimonadota bacterium]|nr:hypothetical protein [Gemmatimonadota bacterium]
MKNLIHEIHRRSLWQVLGIYLAGSWVALQVVEQLAEAAALPDWVQPLALVLLIIGLPIVMATAFVQEGVGASRREGGDTPSAAAASGEPVTPSAPDQGPSEPGRSPAAEGGARGLFTWRRATLGGLGALALFGLLAVGWVVSRTLGIGPGATLVAQGVLDERATVVLADFEAEDAGLSRAATEAFRVDLSQSRVVRLAEPSLLRDALRRMQRPADDQITAELADELAVREGLPAVIAGAINPAGGGYVLSAEIRTAGSGDVLVTHRETAADSTELIDALDALSKRIRERIGESIGGMRSEEPLEQVTTANLDALRRFSQAIEEVEYVGDEGRGLELLEEAIALDPEFAMAWRKLGAILNNRNESRSRRVEALTKAYEFRDRLPERERYLAEASYYENVLIERRRAIRSYESMLDLDPDDIYALNNAGIMYAELRDFEEAISLYERALAADSSGLPPYFNLIVAQANQGDWEGGDRTLEVMSARFPDSAMPLQLGGWTASARGDFEAARDEFGRLREEWDHDPYWDSESSVLLARVDGVEGRLREAETNVEGAQRAAEERGQIGQVVGLSLLPAFLDLEARGDGASARARVEATLSRYPIEDLDPLDRPYEGLVFLYSYAGDIGRASDYMAERAEAIPPELLEDEATERLEAAIAYGEGRYGDAIEILSRPAEGLCLLCGVPDLARAYDAAGQADSAIAVYERYIETPFFNRLFFDATIRGKVLERLGQLFDERGDLQNAAKYYAMFTELWADADADLQPRVRAAQARLEAILAEIG